jgi:hypothetical protein
MIKTCSEDFWEPSLHYIFIIYTECNSSVLSVFLCIYFIHKTIIHQTLPLHSTTKNVSMQYQKKAYNSRKCCNPAAIFFVAVESWTALSTNMAERLSLVQLSLTQKHMVLCLSFRYECGFPLYLTSVKLTKNKWNLTHMNSIEMGWN